MRVSRVLIFCLVVVGWSAAQSGQSASNYMVDRQQAIDLYKAGKYQQALPLLEKLAEQNPADMGIQEMFGYTLWATSTDIEDDATRTAACQKARTALLKAKELGDNSNLLQIVWPAVNEGCSRQRFANKGEVGEIMRKAEAAYTQGDFDNAIRGYEQALALDPKLYSAALFAGDVYYKKKDHDKAAEWFAKAVAIDPNVETAYRYWGDDLLSQGKIAEAREKFIDALLGWPYNNRPWIGLKQWAEHAKVNLRTVSIKSPNSVSAGQNGTTNITVDSTKLKDDQFSSVWLAYDMGHVVWRNQKFAQKYPGQPYRHTLDEEVDCLSMLAKTTEELMRKQRPARIQEQLLVVMDLDKKGLLEPYVLLSAPDPEIAKDYAAYRDQHRDKLREYVSTYLVPPAPAQ